MCVHEAAALTASSPAVQECTFEPELIAAFKAAKGRALEAALHGSSDPGAQSSITGDQHAGPGQVGLALPHVSVCLPQTTVQTRRTGWPGPHSAVHLAEPWQALCPSCRCLPCPACGRCRVRSAVRRLPGLRAAALRRPQTPCATQHTLLWDRSPVMMRQPSMLLRACLTRATWLGLTRQ